MTALPPYRILVTGSRAWTDAHAVAFALESASLDALGRKVFVVHGACPTGVDYMATRAAWRLGFKVESHPADWDGPCHPECDHGPRRRRRWGAPYCPAAGDYRNQEMVDLGADVAVALLMPCSDPECRRPQPHDSHGATDCAERAQAAGIPVRRVRP